MHEVPRDLRDHPLQVNYNKVYYLFHQLYAIYFFPSIHTSFTFFHTWGVGVKPASKFTSCSGVWLCPTGPFRRSSMRSVVSPSVMGFFISFYLIKGSYRKTTYLPRCSWNILQLRGLTLPISSGGNYVLGNLSAFLLYIFYLLIVWGGVLGEPQRTIPCASHGLY